MDADDTEDTTVAIAMTTMPYIDAILARLHPAAQMTCIAHVAAGRIAILIADGCFQDDPDGAKAVALITSQIKENIGSYLPMAREAVVAAAGQRHGALN